MAYPNVTGTNFGQLADPQLKAWSRDFWSQARNLSFINQFAGKGTNSVVQRITDLTKSKKGTVAQLTLVNDLTGDGVTGDYQLEGNEEGLHSSKVEIEIDQLRHATRSDGKLDDQKQIVSFREESRDRLAYWAADRMDQMAFLTMSGIPYSLTNNGATRPTRTSAQDGTSVGYHLNDLAFANDVTAPSDERHLVWTASGLDAATATSATVNADVLANPSYEMVVNLKAYAKDNYIRGIRTKGNDELFHLFLTPQGMAKLKLDPDFIANVRNAGVRGGKNELFAGSSSILVDGVVVHEFRHVYSSQAAAAGSKLGNAGAQDGQRALFCGAQAMGLADLGSADWVERDFDYGNRQGISAGKMIGMLKPKFHSNYVTGTTAVQDFGVVALDTAV